MTADTYPYFLANRPVREDRTMPVTDKFSGEVFAGVARAGPEAIEEGSPAQPRRRRRWPP